MDQGADAKVVHARASVAKLFASEAAWRCADRVVQVFGGRGYMREFPAERYLRELRVDRIWEGTSEIQRLIVARALEKRGVGARRRLSPVATPDPAAAPCRAAHRPAAAVRAAVDRGRRGEPALVARAHGPRQPGAHGQRDPLPLREPQLRRRRSGSRATRRLAALPGAPRLGDPRGQPAARGAVRPGGRRGRRPEPRDPGRRRGRGRRAGRGDAARGGGDRDPPRGGAARPQLHGRGRLDDQQLHLHRRRQPVAAARPRRRASPSRAASPTRSSTRPGRGSGTAGSCRWAPRSCSTCATTSRTASTTPRPTPSCCSWRASSGRSGSSPSPTARWSWASRSSR